MSPNYLHVSWKVYIATSFIDPPYLPWHPCSLIIHYSCWTFPYATSASLTLLLCNYTKPSSKYFPWPCNPWITCHQASPIIQWWFIGQKPSLGHDHQDIRPMLNELSTFCLFPSTCPIRPLIQVYPLRRLQKRNWCTNQGFILIHHKLKSPTPLNMSMSHMKNDIDEKHSWTPNWSP